MRIRTSIKAIFLIFSVCACLILGRLFFVLMFDYYKEGAANVTRSFLQDAGQNSSGDTTFGGIIIRSEWDAIPEELRAFFPSPPTQLGQMIKELKYTEGEPSIIYVMLTTNGLGEPVFVTKAVDWGPSGVILGNVFGDLNLMIYGRALVFSSVFAVIFAGLLLFVLKVVISPLEALKAWALAMADNNGERKPEHIHFRFREFSEVARIISQSLEIQRLSLKKEEEFLQFSSHELRTPLAIVRSNTDLLKKLTVNETGKTRRSVERIDVATQSMTRLVETFLWLSREDGSSIKHETFDLQVLVNELVSELGYLLEGKSVQVEVSSNNCELNLPFTPCRIVLSNLIANAFQHAMYGSVIIVQENEQITITNAESEDQHDTGFGLGLRLVERMVGHFGWDVDVVRNNNLYSVRLSLNTEACHDA